MISLRELKEKDIYGMLEWMHDPEINCFFRFNARDMDYAGAYNFVVTKSEENKHFAIVDERDEYIGTISLKDIDCQHKKAEYAISVRKRWHGSGAAKEATKLLLQYAFEELGLHRVYLNVLSDNTRAIRFYEKCGFVYEGEFRDDLLLNGEWKSLKWFACVKSCWKIIQIFDGDYGCEELVPGAKPKVSVTLENEKGERKYISVEDEWLVEKNLDVGSEWPEEM